MLFSNKIDHFKQNIVIVLLVVTAYVPNVITNIVSNAIDQPKPNTPTKEVPFHEYYIEHNVSEGAAKQSFFEVGVKLIDDKPKPWCIKCTDEILKYCLSRKMLDDHCCCDSSHKIDQIPWIPHSCYKAKEACFPSTKSCIDHTEIRECCCARVLAKRWKSIYSSSMMTTANMLILLVCAVLLVISRSSN